jgi:hypothetical protein
MTIFIKDVSGGPRNRLLCLATAFTTWRWLQSFIVTGGRTYVFSLQHADSFSVVTSGRFLNISFYTLHCLLPGTEDPYGSGYRSGGLLYSESVRFEVWDTVRSELFRVFLSPSRQMPAIRLNRSRQYQFRPSSPNAILSHQTMLNNSLQLMQSH